MVVSVAVLAFFLLTLLASVVTVTVWMRRRKRGKGKGTHKRKVDTTESYYGFEDEVENSQHSVQDGRAYQNMCSSINNAQSAEHLLKISERYEVSEDFSESASAANLLYDAVLNTEEDQGAADTWGEVDASRGGQRGKGYRGEVENRHWGGGGLYEELPFEGHYEEPPIDMKKAGHKGESSSNGKAKKDIRNPELMYAQPNKSKVGKVNGKRRDSKSEEKRPIPTHMYAKPDMAKKMNRRQQKHLGEWGEKKALPQTSPLYQNHQEYEGEAEEKTEAVPQLPPPYIPDEERYYNTRSGSGHPDQERNYDYAVVGQMR